MRAKLASPTSIRHARRRYYGARRGGCGISGTLTPAVPVAHQQRGTSVSHRRGGVPAYGCLLLTHPGRGRVDSIELSDLI
jgi:hypothetical protein